MTLHNLMIVSKSGGLIYNTALSPTAPSVSINDWLRMGSTFHSLHEIAAQCSPVSNDEGILSIECGSFVIRCLQSPTGTKFIMTASANAFNPSLEIPPPSLESALSPTPSPNTVAANNASNAVATLLREVYCIYSDYVLKNPFYELEMPIRCEKFDQKLQERLNKS